MSFTTLLRCGTLPPDFNLDNHARAHIEQKEDSLGEPPETKIQTSIFETPTKTESWPTSSFSSRIQELYPKVEIFHIFSSGLRTGQIRAEELSSLFPSPASSNDNPLVAAYTAFRREVDENFSELSHNRLMPDESFLSEMYNHLGIETHKDKIDDALKSMTIHGQNFFSYARESVDKKITDTYTKNKDLKEAQNYLSTDAFEDFKTAYFTLSTSWTAIETALHESQKASRDFKERKWLDDAIVSLNGKNDNIFLTNCLLECLTGFIKNYYEPCVENSYQLQIEQYESQLTRKRSHHICTQISSPAKHARTILLHS